MGRTSWARLLAVGAVVAVALGGCGVPSVGEVAVIRADDDTYVAHVKICEGSEPVDGLTLDARPHDRTGDDDTDDEETGDVADLPAEHDAQDLAVVDAPGEVVDGSSWPLRVPADVVFGRDVSWVVNGWTYSNKRSLDGPDGRVSTWTELDRGEFLYLTSTGETAVAPVDQLDAWQSEPCWHE
ncbi:hypothetical protein ACOACO_10050 [Nocardioides sp. CPCC 205120]|uniref:hypothetical protein n=1 Tax=Nocardioides sp. CPCC 205120 TaxID=3406462 RepID=UPI003B510671